VDEIIAEWDMKSFENASAHTLSRGTLQRVGIAQALASPRDLVVLDEPTEGLDPIWRLRLRDSIRQLRAEPRCVLVASHDLNEIERLADLVLILNNGRITETVDLRGRAGEPSDYALALATPHESLAHIFPGARAAGNNTYVITATDALDLNARVAALIESGALILSLAPAADLEQRVARAVRPEST